jgi:hypothetical protein
VPLQASSLFCFVVLALGLRGWELAKLAAIIFPLLLRLLLLHFAAPAATVLQHTAKPPAVSCDTNLYISGFLGEVRHALVLPAGRLPLLLTGRYC